MSREIIEAVQTIEREKGIDEGTLVQALEDALLAAYKKTPGAARHADDDLDIDWEQVPEELIQREDVTPEDFGRIAAQTAKQVILQRIREAERAMMFEEYQDRVGELVTGLIQQSDSRYTLVQLRERVEALLPKSEQVWNERYDHGARIKAVITDVSGEGKGPTIVVSRRNPELIRKLFELEVPEIADKLVEIVNVAREPGYRSKIAVISHADGVDPVGACVGPRGSRVRMVVSELRGEKIDIIPFNEEPARFVAKALSPARVREVLVDDEAKQATVIVPDDQLSLAIGKDGLNARLAARLTGWRVDIRSETEFAEEESEIAFDEPEVSGRCACILANGKRCPNASLPGSRYCGLPAHQALEGTGTDYLVPPEEGEGEVPAEADEPLEVEGAPEADGQPLDVDGQPVAAEEPLEAEQPLDADGQPLEVEESLEVQEAVEAGKLLEADEVLEADEPLEAEELAAPELTAGAPAGDDVVTEEVAVEADVEIGEAPAEAEAREAEES